MKKKENINTVKDSLKSICLSTEQLKIKDMMNKHTFWINQYGTFALDKKEKENFYKIANFIRNEYKNGDLADVVSKKDIENYLFELISKVIILSTEEEKLEVIKNFEIDFDNQIEDQIKSYEILFPILALKIESRFSFGNISFYPFSNYQLNKEMKFINKLHKQNKVVKEDEKKEWIRVLRKQLSEYLTQSMVKCDVKGTITASNLKSYNDTLLHINVMKFLVYDFKTNSPTKDTIINEKQHFETVMKTTNSFRTTEYLPIEFNFDLKNLNIFRTKKAISLKRILKKERKDDIDNRILSSINWAVNSIEKAPTVTDESDFFDSSVYMTPNKHQLSQCLLNVVIAFETLLIFKKERSRKIELLKYRSIALLDNTGFEDSFIIEKINSAYKLRSEIVHEGKFNNTPVIVFQLYLFFRDIVFALIVLKDKENITTNDQLKKWFLMEVEFIKYKENKSKFIEAKNNQ